MTRKLIGFTGVDSGTLMIIDPCYIDRHWTKENFNDQRDYVHKITKRLFTFATFWEPKTVKSSKRPASKIEIFTRFDKKTSTGKTMNEMIRDMDVEAIKPLASKETISYNKICQTTLASKHQIDYNKSNTGLAVVFNSGYGDGTYAVYGTFNKDGRCIKVEIDCSGRKVSQKLYNEYIKHENSNR